jgi:hypothetical protein
VANFAGIARWSAIGFSIGGIGYVGTGVEWSNTTTQDFWAFTASPTGINETKFETDFTI